MEYLREKGALRNPAGFMKVAARVAWREIHGFDIVLPDNQAPKKRKRRRSYRDPKKDPIWKSKSYREWRAAFFTDIWEWHDDGQEVSF